VFTEGPLLRKKQVATKLSLLATFSPNHCEVVRANTRRPFKGLLQFCVRRKSLKNMLQ